ncbi:MAG: DNA-binding domain-containing protein [Bradyrhizobium sp.]|nr:DNA-binding domain-containing protein [Bradyrhizobium sp.]
MPATFQATFAEALLDAAPTLPPGIAARTAAIPARRFAVYRNNVMASLAAALARRYPVIERLVGDEFFAATARQFVMQHPPRSPLLVQFGDDFADFIAVFGPARELPYLADVARLEAARTRAYHAEDATPLGADSFAALDAEALGDIRLQLHPSAAILRSPFPIVTIWAMNSGETESRPIELGLGEDALVVRPHLEVEVRALPPGGAAFLHSLADGIPLRDAIAAALDDHDGFDLTGNLAGLIGSGIVRAIVPPAAGTA